MRLLDAYCGAGGAGMGYHRAGFDVVGVDLAAQPRYPFEFHQCDAVEFIRAHGHEFDAIHASPPCQMFTPYRRKGHGVGDGSPNLIPPTRAALVAAQRPYVIENVEQAAGELVSPVKLCGSMFGLDVQRHRLFETNVPVMSSPCNHTCWSPRFPPATNRANLRRTVEIGVWRIPLSVQRTAMGIDWMTLPELSQAIPPAYTELVGGFLREHLIHTASVMGRHHGHGIDMATRSGCHNGAADTSSFTHDPDWSLTK
jgi:DNA (cytosine-5)-methyltransferase 1